jgi:hypothetical protein
MKLLDKIALNSLIKTITNFILAILKMFKPTQHDVVPDKKRPVLDFLRRWIK